MLRGFTLCCKHRIDVFELTWNLTDKPILFDSRGTDDDDDDDDDVDDDDDGYDKCTDKVTIMMSKYSEGENMIRYQLLL